MYYIMVSNKNKHRAMTAMYEVILMIIFKSHKETVINIFLIHLQF